MCKRKVADTPDALFLCFSRMCTQMAWKLYKDDRQMARRRKETRASLAWRNQTRKDVGLELNWGTNQKDDPNLRIDVIEWRSGGDSVALNLGPYIAALDVGGHKNNKGQWPTSPWTYKEDDNTWVYSQMQLGMQNHSTVIHWHWKSKAEHVELDVEDQKYDTVRKAVKHHTNKRNTTNRLYYRYLVGQTKDEEKRIQRIELTGFDVLYKQGVGALLFEMEDHGSVVGEGWCDLVNVQTMEKTHRVAYNTKPIVIEETNDAEQVISAPMTGGGLHFTLHWEFQRLLMKNSKLKSSILAIKAERTMHEKSSVSKFEEIYFKLLDKTRKVFEELQMSKLEARIEMLAKEVKVWRTENRGLKHKLREEERSMDERREVFVQLLMWLRKRSQSNLRMLSALERNLLSVRETQFSEFGGTVVKIKKVVHHGVYGMWNPYQR